MEVPTRRFLVFPAGLALVAIALAFVVGRQPRVDACGPFFEQPVFVSVYVPDPPYDKFVAGRLGHVRSTWARLYLTVGYRYLSGRPLDEAEQEAVADILSRREVDPGSQRRPVPSPGDAGRTWPKTRRADANAPNVAAIDPFRPLGKDRFQYFMNCNEAAFETAATTRRARAAVAGYDVGEWLRAQDQVFSNCPGGRTIPEVLPASAPLLARQDRAYQIAAALFYATDYDEAGTAFRSIARDATSPWRTIAPYLAARCLIRKATVGAPEGSFDKTLLEQAGRELRAFAQAAAARDREMAEQLLGFVDARIAPVSRVRQLGTAIERGGIGSGSVKRSLWDYKLLLDAANGEVTLFEGADERLKRTQSNFERLAAFRETSDLTDWVITFQAAGADAAGHALARWRESKSPAWLVAAIDKTTKDSAEVEEVVGAARSVDPRSPAYPTVIYHLIRLQLERGREQEARESIDRVLATRPDWPRSIMNELAAWRMALARDLEEFIRFAPRVPAGSATEGDPRVSNIGAGGWAFDVDATAILNHRLPLAWLERIAASRSMADTLREEVGRAAWTRAVLFGDDGAAQRLFAFIERGAPVLKRELTAYRAANTPSERAHAALLLLLKSPGLRPSVRSGFGRDPQVFSRTPAPGESLVTLDTYRDNWWCDASTSSYRDYRDAEHAPPDAPWPAFLDDAARNAARREDAEMSKLPTAPIVLCDRMVAWAKAAPNDARIPEALYLAIRTSRYGCWTKATTASSQAAFQLLKTRYATTEWAQKTKYYY